MFKLASHKNATISNLWEGRGCEGQELVHFRRPFQDWEIEGSVPILELIYVEKVQEEGEDILVWREDWKGIFSVNSY